MLELTVEQVEFRVFKEFFGKIFLPKVFQQGLSEFLGISVAEDRGQNTHINAPLHIVYPVFREYSRYILQNIIEIARGVLLVISYRPMWETMRRKNITTYTLVNKYKFSKGTLDSLKHDRSISTATLDDICRMLDCKVEDVLVYIPEAENNC